MLGPPADRAVADGTPITDAKGRRSYATSAGASPSTGKHVLLAYLPPEHAVEGNKLFVQYFAELYPVTVAVVGRAAAVRPRERPHPGADDEGPRLHQARPGGRRADHPHRGRRAIDTKYVGFAIGPHEECAVEEAVRLVEAHGGESVVLTLGPAEALEQLRDAMAHRRSSRAIHLVTDGEEWDPESTAVGDRRRHPRRTRRRAARSTCCCSATRPATPAATRSRSASGARSAGRS